MGVRATDSFTYSNGLLATASSGKWTKLSGFTDLSVVSNQCKGATASADHVSAYTNAGTLPANMYSQIARVNSNDDGGPTVRSNQTSTFYLLDTSSGNYTVYKCITGSFTQINQVTATTGATDTVYIEVQGTTIKTKQNGTQRNSFTDSAIDGTTVGGLYPGLHAFDTNIIYDNYECGDFVTVAETIIGWRTASPRLFGPFGRFKPPRLLPTTSSQALTLSVSDSLALSDSIVKAVTKPISDSITLTDTAAKLVGKVLSDSITLTDAVAKLVGKVLSDSIALSDSKVLTVGKVLSDSIALTDTLAKAVTKALSDSITVADSKTLLTGKVLSDAVVLSDLTAFLTSKALSDSITLTDTRALMLSKVFSDSITMGDTATAVLVLLLQVSDSFSLTDSAAMVLATACKQLLGCGDNPYSFDSSTASSSGACGKSIAGCPTNEYSFNE